MTWVRGGDSCTRQVSLSVNNWLKDDGWMDGCEVVVEDLKIFSKLFGWRKTIVSALQLSSIHKFSYISVYNTQPDMVLANLFLANQLRSVRISIGNLWESLLHDIGSASIESWGEGIFVPIHGCATSHVLSCIENLKIFETRLKKRVVCNALQSIPEWYGNGVFIEGHPHSRIPGDPCVLLQSILLQWNAHCYCVHGFNFIGDCCI